MKKLIRRKKTSAKVPVGPDITETVNKISQQLLFLEKKIDTLINRSAERSHQRFDRSFRNGQRNQGDMPRKRTYNQAICAECKKTCEVPFKPTGDRPVYCSECFAKRKGDRNDQPGRGNQKFNRRRRHK